MNSRLPYTTGTWTPVLKGTETAGSFTYISQFGRYVKIGVFVYYWGHIRTSAYTTHPTGAVVISGLPYVGRSGDFQFGGNITGYGGGVNGCVQKINGGYINVNSTEITLLAHSIANPQLRSNATWDSSDSSGYKIMLDSSHQTANIFIAGYYETNS